MFQNRGTAGSFPRKIANSWRYETEGSGQVRSLRVRWRLERLKKAGFTFPPPTGPRPIPHRKVTDEEILVLAQSGLSIPEIAVKLGMGMANAHRRIKRLIERG